MEITKIEIWGYLATTIVILSVMMKDIRKLRIINSVACLMFVIYGVILEAYPIVIMNTIVIFINLWRLKKDNS